MTSDRKVYNQYNILTGIHPDAHASQVERGASARLTNEEISQPVVLKYFETFNAEDFDVTANLFAAEGELKPPFEKSIVGREAIAAYLKKEAQGMKAYPCEETIELLENNDKKVLVSGMVQTPLFGVNVAWQFILNPENEIASVRIKLLASLQELATLKP